MMDRVPLPGTRLRFLRNLDATNLRQPGKGYFLILA